MEMSRPPPDQQAQRKAQAGRAKTDEVAALEGNSRRPGMFENRHLSKGSTTGSTFMTDYTISANL